MLVIAARRGGRRAQSRRRAAPRERSPSSPSACSSAGTYAINDVRDRRGGPAPPAQALPCRRCRRDSPARGALALGLSLMAGGLVLCVAVRPLLLAVGAGYVVLTLSYTVIWRHDRAARRGRDRRRLRAARRGRRRRRAGHTVALVRARGHLRRAVHRRRQAPRRASARSARTARGRGAPACCYTAAPPAPDPGRQRASALFAYCVWAFALPNVERYPLAAADDHPLRACLMRYGIVLRAGDGEAPEELVLRRPLAAARSAAPGSCCSRSVFMPPDAAAPAAPTRRTAGPPERLPRRSSERLGRCRSACGPRAAPQDLEQARATVAANRLSAELVGA